MTKLPELSIFFPFWNEEKNIERVVKSAMEIAPYIADKWEIIIVDDGSTDNTLQIAKKLAKYKRTIKIVSHSLNRGYGSALKEGFAHSSYKYIVFTDGDGQFDFSEVTKFIEKIDKADLVIGYRKKRKDENILRRLLFMNLLKIWDFFLFGFYFKDIDGGFKMIKRKALEQIMPLRSEGAMISTEILAKAKKRGLTITEVGVEHYKRKVGRQTGDNSQVVVRAVLESLLLWWDIRNNRF